MKVFNRWTLAYIDVPAGTWLSWVSSPPPNDVGPILCERQNSGQFTVDPATTNPAWNVADVRWCVPVQQENSLTH